MIHRRPFSLCVSVSLLGVAMVVGCASPDPGNAETQDELTTAKAGAPRLVSPMAGSEVSGLPAFRWATHPTSTESVFEVCRDRGCTSVVATLRGRNGAALPTVLSAGTYYVRGYGTRREPNGVEKKSDFSPVYFFRSTGTNVPTLGALRLTGDLDGDGEDDRVFQDTSTRRFEFSAMGRTNQVGEIQGWSDTNSPAPFWHKPRRVFVAGDGDGNGVPEVVIVADRSIALVEWDEQRRAFAFVRELPFPAGIFQASAAGDVDGDGFADLLVTSELPSRMQPTNIPSVTGVRANIVYGSVKGFGFRTTPIDLPLDVRPTMTSANVSVLGVGDVNGDGYADVAVVYPLREYYGGSLERSPAYVEVRSGGTSPLTKVLARIPHVDTIDAVGDLNGDGLSDLVATEPLVRYKLADNRSAKTTGATYVLLGNRAGLAAPQTIANTIVPGSQGCPNKVSTRDPIEVALRVTDAGDVDGDGRADIVFAEVPLETSGFCVMPSNIVLRRGTPAGVEGTSTITASPNFATYVQTNVSRWIEIRPGAKPSIVQSFSSDSIPPTSEAYRWANGAFEFNGVVPTLRPNALTRFGSL
jgi:hypothetical protein